MSKVSMSISIDVDVYQYITKESKKTSSISRLINDTFRKEMQSQEGKSSDFLEKVRSDIAAKILELQNEHTELGKSLENAKQRELNIRSNREAVAFYGKKPVEREHIIKTISTRPDYTPTIQMICSLPEKDHLDACFEYSEKIKQEEPTKANWMIADVLLKDVVGKVKEGVEDGKGNDVQPDKD